MTRPFYAKFSTGFCHDCGLPIEEGDLIAYGEDDDLYHAECVVDSSVSINQPKLFDLQAARHELRQP